MVSGRFNSSVSWVPAGRVAERCLPSQCAVAEPAPIAPPIRIPGAAADQSADQHAAGSAAAGFECVAAVVALSFELAFLIHVSAANVGVGQGGVEEVTLAGGQNHGFGKNSDGRPAGDASRLTHLGDAAFDGRSRGNQRSTVHDDRLA